MVFRRGMANLRPVNSRKNIHQDIVIIAAAAIGDFNLVDTVDTAGLTDTNGVSTGGRVNTVYLEIWIYGSAVAGVNSPITWYLAKNPGSNLTLPNPSVAGANDNKRWIFAMGKGLVGNQANGQPGYLVRGWFSIPKRMRRMGADDQITLKIENNTANNINVCRMSIYKWYI